MRCLWKEIYRLNFLRDIAKVFQYGKIACECCGVAGDVDDAPRVHIGEGTEDDFGAARTRRIDDNDIGANALLVKCRHDGGRVAYDELGVLYMVVACVLSCVEDGGLYDFDAVDLARLLRKEEGDCTRSAVGIDDGFRAVQVGISECLLVETFCLARVDLKKRARGNVKVQPSQGIEDGRSAPEENGIAPHDDVVAIGLDILMHADEMRQPLAQETDKVLCTRQLLGRRDNDRHQLAPASDASDDVSQDALVCVLVVDRNMQFFGNLAHSIRKIVVHGALDVAVLRVDDAMAALCEAADNEPAFIDADGKLHLVPIVPRVIRRQCFVHVNLRKLADMRQCLYDLRTFGMQLCLIGEVLELAAAACVVDFTARRDASGALLQDLPDPSACIGLFDLLDHS